MPPYRFIDTTPSDTTPLAEARRRLDNASVEQLFRGHRDRLQRYFIRRLGCPNVAADLCADTFARALEQRHQFRGSAADSAVAWLYAIARSLLWRYIRDSRGENAALRRVATRDASDVDTGLDHITGSSLSTELFTRLHDLMAALPAEQREAIHLRVVDELDYDDVAACQDVSMQAARARVSRGLRALSDDLTS